MEYKIHANQILFCTYNITCVLNYQIVFFMNYFYPCSLFATCKPHVIIKIKHKMWIFLLKCKKFILHKGECKIWMVDFNIPWSKHIQRSHWHYFILRKHVLFPQNNSLIQMNFWMKFVTTCYENWLKLANKSHFFLNHYWLNRNL
jgi:hypothetical protein